MFETITDEDERGQVGIGTLIVFIAMVLVAAIAAGVLINTAGSLQSQASDTGTETQQAVANQIEVTHGVAEASAAGEDFDELRLVVKKSAGSDVIDLTSVTIQYTSDDISTTLVHAETEEATNGAEQFNSYNASEYSGHGDTAASNQLSLTETSDRAVIVIDLSDTSLDEPLEPGDSASVNIVDQSGAQYTYGVTMPQTVSDEQTVAQV